MRKHLLASAALLLLVATPAVARDTGGYVGIDIGAVWPNSQNILGSATFAGPFVCNAIPPAVCTTPTNISRADVGSLHFGAGVDADLFGGYDFGMFRLEGEAGYKSGHAKHATFNSGFINAVNTATGDALTTSSKFNIDETSHVWDIMMNGWLDVGGQSGVGGGVGAGLGYANVDQFGHSNGKFAWQLLAQAYYPVSRDFDIGIKYRYFHAGETHGTNVFTASPPTAARPSRAITCTPAARRARRRRSRGSTRPTARRRRTRKRASPRARRATTR